MSRKAQEILVAVLVVAVLVVVLADSARYFLRIDLTRSKAFTISPVSRSLFTEVPGTVHITYYLSDSLRSLSPVPGRVIDLLDEYAADSRGKITVTVADPRRSGREESARNVGILPQQIKVIQQNEQRTSDVYSGISMEYLDRFTSIPAVFDPDSLEFTLDLGLKKLLAGRSLRVGIIVGEPGESLEKDFDTLRTGLSRNFSLRAIAPGADIPPEADVVMVFDGTGLSAAELEPIDRFLMDGGKVLFAAKGLRVETESGFSAAPVGKSALLDMIEAYGVRVGREMVLDRANRDYRLPQDVSGQVRWETIGSYPPWVSVRASDVSRTSPITKTFSGLDLLWPTFLQAVPREGVTAEALVKTTTSAWVMGEPFTIDPYKVPQSGEKPAGPENQKVLAFALSGTFPSAFAGRAGEGKGARAGAAGPAAAGSRALSSKPTRVVVIADDAFASDLMQFSNSLYNVLFVENAVLWLSGNADLLAIRARAPVDSRLDRIENRGSLMLFSEVLNVCIIPLLVLVFGLVRGLRRRGKQ